MPDVVPRIDADAGRTKTSALWLREVSGWHFQHYFDRGVSQGWDAFPQWTQSIPELMSKPRKNVMDGYQAFTSATLGTFSDYTPGMRVTMTWHRCDGTLRLVRSVRGNGRPMTISLPPMPRGHVVAGTYIQATVTAPGRLPVAEHMFQECPGGPFARDATALVNAWGEKLTGQPRVGQVARISKVVKTTRGEVTRTWYLDGKPVARNARRFVPKAAHVGKRLTVKVKAARGKKAAKHTFVFGKVRASR